MLAVVAAFAVFMFGIDVALWIRTDQFHAVTAFGRLAVIGGLGAFVLNGRDWARIVLALWLGVMSITYVIGAAFASNLGTLFGITMLVIAVAVAAGSIVMFSSGDIQQLVEDTGKANRASDVSSTDG